MANDRLVKVEGTRKRDKSQKRWKDARGIVFQMRMLENYFLSCPVEALCMRGWRYE